MKLRSLITLIVGLSLMVAASPALAALPTVNTFTMAASGFSPVPVLAFTASDTDGTVVGYIITTTTTKPSASDSRWTATPWTTFNATTIGTITLYAYAKDNANGVSANKSFATTVVGVHNHDTVYVNEGQANSISASMIGAATITTGNIGNGQITNDLLGANAITNGKIQDGTVGTLDLADNAVTDAKILGEISTAKIIQGPGSGLNADLLDGLHAVSFATAAHIHAQSDVTGLATALSGKAAEVHTHDASTIISGTIDVSRLAAYNGVRVVHKGPADGVNTFNTIAAALASLGDTSVSKYAVIVMPGVYSETFVVQNNVAVMGVDKAAVTLDLVGAGGIYAVAVRLGSNARLSGMTVINHGSFGYGIRGENVTIEDLVLNISDEGGVGTFGIDISGRSTVKGVTIRFADPVGSTQRIGISSETQHAGDNNDIQDVVMTSSPTVFGNIYGIYCWGNDPDGVTSIRNIALSGNMYQGIFARGSNIKVYNSSLRQQDGRPGINYTLTWDTNGTIHSLDVFNSEVGYLQVDAGPGGNDLLVGRVYGSTLDRVWVIWGQAYISSSEIAGTLTGDIKTINCFDRDLNPVVFP